MKLVKNRKGRLNLRPAARAVTLVEELVVIGVLSILAALIIAGLPGVRHRSREVACLAQLRDHARVLAVYAVDYTDHWPYAGSRARTHHAFAPRVDGTNPPYGVAAGTWHLPVLDAYQNNPFAEPLICPADTRSLAERDRVAAELGVEPTKLAGTLDRQLSMAMYLAPQALDPANPSVSASYHVPQTQSAVTFPSSKASLFELTPWHDTQYRGGVIRHRPTTHSVTSVDGSARNRSKADVTPGVPWEALHRQSENPSRLGGPILAMEQEAAKFNYTPMGVWGRDWP
jgi:type II secretory pathway pseudopilin PulG